MYLIVAFLHFELFFFLVALQDNSLYFSVVIAISVSMYSKVSF
jgi:hypothetical protein